MLIKSSCIKLAFGFSKHNELAELANVFLAKTKG